MLRRLLKASSCTMEKRELSLRKILKYEYCYFHSQHRGSHSRGNLITIQLLKDLHILLPTTRSRIQRSTSSVSAAKPLPTTHHREPSPTPSPTSSVCFLYCKKDSRKLFKRSRRQNSTLSPSIFASLHIKQNLSLTIKFSLLTHLSVYFFIFFSTLRTTSKIFGGRREAVD